MNVNLIHHTPLSICATAIRTCWSSQDKGGCYTTPTDELVDKDIELVSRVALKFKHQSTIEHINYNFFIAGISRAVLQELARHRIASLSVKSTRYTLKELKAELPYNHTEESLLRAEKYLVMTPDIRVNKMSVIALENLRILLTEGISNDKAKYSLPEAYRTELTWSVNARALRNFIALRTNPAALWEIRELANNIYNVLPEEHKFLFKDTVYTKPLIDN